MGGAAGPKEEFKMMRKFPWSYNIFVGFLE